MSRSPGVRRSLRPSTDSVMSRRWGFYVNGLAASPFVSRTKRQRIYRRLGLDIRTDAVFPGCYFHTANIHIGFGAILNQSVHIENTARVEIGERTGLGLQTTVITSNHDLGSSHMRLGSWFQEPVVIGTGCWIGARCLILPGVTIGDGCLVAAGSVVRGALEPDGLYAGVPVRRIRDLEP